MYLASVLHGRSRCYWYSLAFWADEVVGVSRKGTSWWLCG